MLGTTLTTQRSEIKESVVLSASGYTNIGWQARADLDIKIDVWQEL